MTNQKDLTTNVCAMTPGLRNPVV